MKIKIDNREIEVQGNETILQAAARANIEIPSLCYNKNLDPYSSCFVCVVEVEGAKSFLPACSARVREGMVVHSNTDKISKLRKFCLEPLLSDHYADCFAPCKMTCPAGIDIQGYIAHIANGDYQAALNLIKERNPLPLVCGSVCPHPCEKECRRNLVDEPVAINSLKKFVAELDLENKDYVKPICQEFNGQKIAVIGAGPAGLSAAYYLRILGYQVKIFEMNDKAGGMLRYGIPEYRLPNKKLDKEIERILELGIEIEYQKKLGKDFTIANLKKEGFAAIFLALGAWKAFSLQLEGENHPAIIGGIDFLKQVVEGKIKKISDKVAIVGGGNTAMDCARTAVRLGAKKVSVVYRRSRKEMPAESYEIEEAMEEGIEFLFLHNPTKLVFEQNRLKGLDIIEMKLGEPDASGRRRPIPVPGSEKLFEFDLIIPAISQYTDLNDLDLQEQKINLTKWGTFAVDESSMQTSCPDIFAAGDAQSGPATAIQAIAGGRRAAYAIDQFLKGNKISEVREEKIFNISRGKLENFKPEHFKDEPKKKREHPQVVEAAERKTNFKQYEGTLTASQAKLEASRCLSCGCLDVYECSLRKYSVTYQADTKRILGDFHDCVVDLSNNHIIYDASKCIKCTKCVRICASEVGASALGLAKRGFDVMMAPTAGSCFKESTCIECGACVANCPTGALSFNYPANKLGPFKEDIFKTNCDICQLHCDLEAHCDQDKLLYLSPVKESTSGVPCKRAIFDFNDYLTKGLATSLYQKDKNSEEISLEKAQFLLREFLNQGNSKFIISQTLCKELQEEAITLAKRYNAEIAYYETKYIFSSYNLPEKVDLVLVFGAKSASVAPALTNRALSRYPEAQMIYLNEPDLIFDNSQVQAFNFDRDQQFELANQLSFSKMETNFPAFGENFFKGKTILALIPYDKRYREISQILCMNSSIYMKSLDVSNPNYRFSKLKDLAELQVAATDNLVYILSGQEKISFDYQVPRLTIISPKRYKLEAPESLQIALEPLPFLKKTFVELLGSEITSVGWQKNSAKILDKIWFRKI